MGIEMSFGIIFIGNGELSKKDYARYIEKHKLREVVKIYFFLQKPRPLKKINNPDTLGILVFHTPFGNI